MKNLLISIVFLFTVQCSLFSSYENDLYLLNIEKALDFCHFDEKFETSKYPNIREEVKQLFLQIYENEKVYPNYVQCLTAQDSFFYAYQVIAKELYRRIYGNPRENFEFLRFPIHNLVQTKEQFFLKYPSLIVTEEELAKELHTTPTGLNEAIKAFEIEDEEEHLKIAKGEEVFEDCIEDFEDDDEEDSRFAINDTLPEVSGELLSVNFTLETYRELDSALFVFLSGKAVGLSSLSNNEQDYKDKCVAILRNLFASLSISHEKIDECLDRLVKAAPRTSFGIINQIFLPRESVTNFLYLSLGGGFVYSFYDSKFEESYNEFQNNRQDSHFRTFRNFQARIIAGTLFLDPRVRIFRYTLIPNELQSQYEAIVKETLDGMLAPELLSF